MSMLVTRSCYLRVGIGGLRVGMLALVGYLGAVPAQLGVTPRTHPYGIVELLRGQRGAVFRTVGAEYLPAFPENHSHTLLPAEIPREKNLFTCSGVSAFPTRTPFRNRYTWRRRGRVPRGSGIRPGRPLPRPPRTCRIVAIPQQKLVPRWHCTPIRQPSSAKKGVYFSRWREARSLA